MAGPMALAVLGFGSGPMGMTGAVYIVPSGHYWEGLNPLFPPPLWPNKLVAVAAALAHAMASPTKSHLECSPLAHGARFMNESIGDRESIRARGRSTRSRVVGR